VQAFAPLLAQIQACGAGNQHPRPSGAPRSR